MFIKQLHNISNIFNLLRFAYKYIVKGLYVNIPCILAKIQFIDINNFSKLLTKNLYGKWE